MLVKLYFAFNFSLSALNYDNARVYLILHFLIFPFVSFHLSGSLYCIFVLTYYYYYFDMHTVKGILKYSLEISCILCMPA